jgi:signal transduction histidine kinase
VRRIRDLVARVREMEPERFDRLFALLLATGCAVDVATRAGHGESRAATAAGTAALLVVVLLWRRRAPLLAVVVASAILLVQEAFEGGVTRNGMVPFVLLIVLYYSLGSYAREDREAWIGGAIAWAALMGDLVVAASVPSDIAGTIIFGTLFVAVPLGIGRMLRRRHTLAATLEERIAELEVERERRAQAAVEDDRARIARELHDLVAHSIGAMTVQADAIGRVIDTRPDQAREAFEAIETTGREALTEMRRLLGVLRRDDDDLALAPQPSLDHLAALVQRARAAGLEVEVQIEGERRTLPGGVDLVAYRVVQEALGASVEQPGARTARVTVRYGAREVELEVVDDRAGEGLARLDRDGIPAMTERVSLYGGRLESGREEHGYVVRARLPLELVAA